MVYRIDIKCICQYDGWWHWLSGFKKRIFTKYKLTNYFFINKRKKTFLFQFIFNNKLYEGMTNSKGIWSDFSSCSLSLSLFFSSFLFAHFFILPLVLLPSSIISLVNSPGRFKYVSHFYYFFKGYVPADMHTKSWSHISYLLIIRE